MRDEGRLRFPLGHDQVKQMGGVNAGRRLHEAHTAGIRPFSQFTGVTIPNRESAALNLVELAELRVEHRRVEFAQKVAGPPVDPAVLVDLPAKELRAVGALFPHDLGAFDQRGIVDEECATLAAVHILGVMETLRGEDPNAAEGVASGRYSETVGVVLDDGDAVLERDRGDRRDIDGHAAVVHHRDRPGLRTDSIRHLLRIDIAGCRVEVNEQAGRARSGDRVGRGREREARKDYFVPRPELEQVTRHLQCVGARRREEHMPRPRQRTQTVARGSCVWPVPMRMIGGQHARQIAQLIGRAKRSRKRDDFGRNCRPFAHRHVCISSSAHGGRESLILRKGNRVRPLPVRPPAPVRPRKRRTFTTNSPLLRNPVHFVVNLLRFRRRGARGPTEPGQRAVSTGSGRPCTGRPGQPRCTRPARA